MSRIRLPILLVLICLVSSAWAQDQSTFLTRYNQAISDLNSSVITFNTSSEESLADLNNAENRLRPLSENSSSTSLVQGMTATFERARDTVIAQSEIDLRAQVSVLKGGFERLLYEQALNDLSQGNAQQAQQNFTQLAVDMNLSQNYADALVAATNATSAQQIFEQAVAESIQNRIATAQRLNASEAVTEDQRNEAYLSLAEAYGQLIPIQDSPRVSENLNNDLINAVNALVESRTEELSNQLSVVDSQVTQVVASTAPATAATTVATPTAPTVTTPTVTTPTVPEVTTTTPEVAAPVATPSVTTTTPVVTAPTVTTPAVTTPEVTTPAVTTPNVETPATDSIQTATSTVPEATDATSVPAAPAVTTTDMRTFQEQLEEAEMNALRSDLQRYGAPVGQLDSISQLYLNQGYRDVNSALTEMWAESARALKSVEIGDQDQALAHIAVFRDNYETLFKPIIIGRGQLDFDRSTIGLLDSLENAPALRLQDTAVLVGHVDAIGAVISNSTPPATHSTIVATTTRWIGWIRLIAMILLAILAFFPIRLLFLAFGGGNRNWQWVGFALFLLLLPIIWEGLSFIGSIVANLSGIPAFNSLSSFSIFQNTISQILWVFITAIAIIFATMGLYGICVQFGLIGRRNKPVAATATATDTQTTLTESELGSDTVVDWDEEF